jgi:hypothetical protein
MNGHQLRLIAIACFVAFANAISLSSLSSTKLQLLQSGGLASVPAITFDTLLSSGNDPLVVFATRRAG